MQTTINYTIEDCLGFGYDINVDFAFHEELDGQLVYDGAFTIQWIDDGIGPIDVDEFDVYVLEWLKEREYLIYEAAKCR